MPYFIVLAFFETFLAFPSSSSWDRRWGDREPLLGSIRLHKFQVMLPDDGRRIARLFRNRLQVTDGMSGIHDHIESLVVFWVVGWVGLEPTTNALKGRCSTIELPTRATYACAAQTLHCLSSPAGSHFASKKPRELTQNPEPAQKAQPVFSEHLQDPSVI